MIAMIDLLTEHWCEPPRASRLDLSTLVQQVLSLIVQHGGASPRQAYDVLCGSGGPFTAVTEHQFVTLLRDLAGHDVLVQAGDGTLLTGERGDAEVNHYSFFAAFATAEEYRLVHDGDTLGTMPMNDPLHHDDLLTFAGRQWRVVSVDDEDKVIVVCPASGGVPRIKGPMSGAVHTVVRHRMRTILAGDGEIGYADHAAARLLSQARRGYAELRLGERAVLRDGSDTLILPWVGDLQLVTLAELLRAEGLDAEHDGIAVRIADFGVDAALGALRAIVVREPPAEAELAEHVLNKMAAKYDHWLGDRLLCAQYASTSLDCAGAIAAAEAVVALSAT
jgi:ATP-dependent Lhr-like helicase